MSNKRAIRTDTLNHQAFVKIDDEEKDKILNPHCYYNESRHTIIKLIDENRHHASRIGFDLNGFQDNLQNISNRFYQLQNNYDLMKNYPNFIASHGKALTDWVWEEYIYPQMKSSSMVSNFKDSLQLAKDFEETRYNSNGGHNSWDIQRKLQEPLNEEYNTLCETIYNEWATIRDKAKVSIGLGGLVKNCLLFSQPEIHYNRFYGEETDETYIEKIREYFHIDFELKELTAEKQQEYITYVADYEPVLFIRMAQWMQFFADNPSIETVAHTTTSAYKSHDAFYRCSMNEVANANNNKHFYMPLKMGIEAPTIKDALDNFSWTVTEWSVISEEARRASVIYNAEYADKEVKTHDSLVKTLNAFLKEKYENTGTKDCVLNLIAIQQGFGGGTTNVSFINETLQYHDFNRETDVTFYMNHIGTLGDGIIDLSKIGINESDRHELSRMWNKKESDVLQSHNWAMQRLIQQMTDAQNTFNESKKQRRERLMEMIQQ